MDRADKMKIIEGVGTEDSLSYRSDRIASGGRTFVLRREMACDVGTEGPLWVISCEPLRIHAYGDSRKDAIAEFGQEFAMLWDEYALADDRDLSQDALAIKTFLKQIVLEVVEE